MTSSFVDLRLLRELHERPLAPLCVENENSPDKIAEALTRMRIPFTRESECINVLDGVASVVAPYRVGDCRSINETVLKKLRAVVEGSGCDKDVA